MRRSRCVLVSTVLAVVLGCLASGSAFASGRLVAGSPSQLSSSSPNTNTSASSATSTSSATSATASTTTTPASARSTLPYTGVDIGIAFALGLVMLGGGFLLRSAFSRA